MNVIYGGDDLFDHLIYPEQNAMHNYWIQNQIANLSNTVMSSLTQAGREFMGACKGIYEQLQNNDIVQKAHAALKMNRNLHNPNQIRELYSLDEIRLATGPMVRWVMAEPSIKQRLIDDRCFGYGDQFVDLSPGLVGEEDYSYRRVMNGVVQDTTDEEGKPSWVCHHYIENLIPTDRELTPYEQFDILNTWDLMKAYMAQNQDPTDPLGGEL